MIDAVVALYRLSLMLAVACCLAGCGERRVSAPVSGRVTLNGEPQEGIFIYFEPDLPPKHDPLKGLSKSYARSDKDGRFSMAFMDADKDRKGALVTSHTVTADDERTFGGGAAPDEVASKRPQKSRVPSNWSARFEVPASGSTEANFELSGGK